ncbi:MAG: integrase arm-type DNA-binding domain-containing protein, partial [Rhodospirillales bacterium]|nr:integrase arm-type DNA-binding domain-containing protein [Rhodospirillales bacterium]
MAEPRSRPSFGRRLAAARPREKRYSVWDDTISGLGVYVYPNGTRTFCLRRVLPNGRVRSATLGSANAMSLPEARNEARRVLASLLDTPETVSGPRYPGRPMAAFADEFLERHARHWKPGTLASNRRFIRDVILPAFGHMTVDAIAVEHVQDWFASMAHRPGTANRTMPVLSVMMRMAELWGYRVHNTNPCKG